MIVALVSGGVDSVCLLDVLVASRGVAEVTVLHVDHGLREGSAADADFVRGLHPEVVVERLQPAGARAGNVQAWARGERYRRAFALADRLGGCDVATGHTASDQVEGVLYRLAASPGRRALLGMRPRDGRLVRPLLGWTREDVLTHARARGLAWREDPTNVSRAYARNRARAALVPALRALHPAAEANVLRTLDVLRDEAAVLDAAVEEALSAAAVGAAAGVDCASLAALPPALRRLCLQRLADDVVPGHAPAVGARVDEVLALASTGGTARLDLGAGLVATVAYGALTIGVAHVCQAGVDKGATPLRVPGRTHFFGGVLDAAVVAGVEPADGDVGIDAGLTVRTRRPGDRMAPLGMGGRTRSLQDLFVDRKVPAPARDAWPVVCAGDAVVWVPRVATAEAARVTSVTTPRVRLRWAPGPVGSAAG